MTLTMALATDEMILFATDRRRTSMRDNSIYYDDMKKLYKVNDRVFIMFGGDMNITVSCREHLQEKTLNNATVQAVSLLVRKYLRGLLKDKGDMEQDIIIGGIGDGNKIVIASMSHTDNYKPEYTVPKIGEFRWKVCYADVNPHEYIQSAVDELIENSDVLTIDKIKEMAAYAIRKVSENDIYVSSTYNIDHIIKGETINNGDTYNGQ